MATAHSLRLKVIVDKEEPDELLLRLRTKIVDVINDKRESFRWMLDPVELAEHLALTAVTEVLAVRPLTPAETELANLHQGEEPYLDQAVVPTPGQLLYQWIRATPQQRLDWAARSLSNAERASSCFESHHESQLAELRTVRERNAAVDDARRTWFAAAEQRQAAGHGTGPRHLADLYWQLTKALGHQVVDPVARCEEHDGVCFPQPFARCSAHGDEQCLLCHRHPSSCANASGSCAVWAATGMHWDTCQHRLREPLVPPPVDEPEPAAGELVHLAEEEHVGVSPLVGGRFQLQPDGRWTMDIAGGTLTVPAGIPQERREQLRAYLDAYSNALDENGLPPEQARADSAAPDAP